jgi:hypothetical protein
MWMIMRRCGSTAKWRGAAATRALPPSKGLNMRNRVVLAETVNPGNKFQIAVFGFNGPISVALSNFIFFRDAKVEFYR